VSDARQPRPRGCRASDTPASRTIRYQPPNLGAYLKLLTANLQVDQGAALIMCSAEAADRAGVPRDRWVFPWRALTRTTSGSSPPARVGRVARRSARSAPPRSITLASASTMWHTSTSTRASRAVEIAAHELGLPLDDPARPADRHRGLTFAGGPGNNATMHALAALVARLRDDPHAVGLATGSGGT